VRQDVLRLLTLWFRHGRRVEVQRAMAAGCETVSVDTWLEVLPQLIARIHTDTPAINELLQSLLARVGQRHPQALIYPITVATKAAWEPRARAAQKILADMKRHDPQMVADAEMCSSELIRAAILWHEMWHEGLEEASRCFFGEGDVKGMLDTLLPLHAIMEDAEERAAAAGNGMYGTDPAAYGGGGGGGGGGGLPASSSDPTTLREAAFHQAFGRELREALEWVRRYERCPAEEHGRMNNLHQAWDIYYSVFRRIGKMNAQLTRLELHHVAPSLLHATRNAMAAGVGGLALAVPGTYAAGTPIVRIAGFNPEVAVMASKQKPRKLTMHGSDGRPYVFLLKGKEDTRQDERVMQVFGLVNALVNANTGTRRLEITRYAVLPLSHNVGLVEWVPHCDTLHICIRDYREARRIMLNIEHRLMLQVGGVAAARAASHAALRCAVLPSLPPRSWQAGALLALARCCFPLLAPSLTRSLLCSSSPPALPPFRPPLRWRPTSRSSPPSRSWRSSSLPLRRRSAWTWRSCCGSRATTPRCGSTGGAPSLARWR
jgi:serine/threonine-protein kinase mTOR